MPSPNQERGRGQSGRSEELLKERKSREALK